LAGAPVGRGMCLVLLADASVDGCPLAVAGSPRAERDRATVV